MDSSSPREFHIRLNSVSFDYETEVVKFKFDALEKFSLLGELTLSLDEPDFSKKDMDLIMARGWQALRQSLIQMTDEAKSYALMHLKHLPEEKE